MAYVPSVLVLAGSLRSQSYNKKLARLATGIAREAGAQATYLDLRDLALPLFDEDLEKSQGLPDGAKQLKSLLKAHDGLIIASPEYNSSITAALKNAIDWASRATEGEPPLICFAGKVAALLAASPGALGGLRGLVHLRSILGNIQVIVLPDQLAIPKAHEAFDDQGNLTDPRQRETVQRITQNLVRTLAKLHRE